MVQINDVLELIYHSRSSFRTVVATGDAGSRLASTLQAQRSLLRCLEVPGRGQEQGLA